MQRHLRVQSSLHCLENLFSFLILFFSADIETEHSGEVTFPSPSLLCSQRSEANGAARNLRWMSGVGCGGGVKVRGWGEVGFGGSWWVRLG